MRNRIRLHAEIVCDGGHGGRLERIVLDPMRRLISHLVVRAPDGHRRVVSTRAVAEAHATWIKLAMSPVELLACPRFVTTDFSLPAAPHSPPEPLAGEDLLYTSQRARHLTQDLSTGPLPVEHRAVPPPEISLGADEAILCSDRECGRLGEIVWDPEDSAACALVLRQGFLFAREVELPLGWIDWVDQAGVHLKMTAQQVDEASRCFPPYPD